MDQYRAVSKCLRDLIQFKLIHEDDRGQARLHLDRLFAAGRSKKGVTLINAGKPVCYYDKKGNKLGEFHNCTEASRELNIYISVIYRSIKYKRLTRNKHYWKYKEEEA
jgi:hypothetical protein